MSVLALLAGLAVVAGYWYMTRPIGLPRGYVEDFCGDLSRQIMADSLKKFGSPQFTTDRFMAPSGMTVPYFSWSLERDWIGAYVWMWNKDFPFMWVYFGLSLLISYLAVGLVLRKICFPGASAWLIALVPLLFHVPRHFKMWHHFEYMAQHWVYLSFFLDAWIWWRFYREKKVSVTSEFWRLFIQLGVFCSPGYFWGPTVLEWMIMRFVMLAMVWRWRKMGQSVAIRRPSWAAAVPVIGCVAMVLIEIRWFLPLLTEMRKLGTVSQGPGWFAHFGFVVRPLWLDDLFGSGVWLIKLITGLSIQWKLPVIDTPETVVTIGWFYWIPLILAVRALSKKKGGPGFSAVIPFMLLIITAVLYMSWGKPYIVQKAIQAFIPFMKFFRVASRWGQFLPLLTFIVVMLSWSELSSWFSSWFKRNRRQARVWCVAFVALSALEMRWLLVEPNMLPPLHGSTIRLLDGIRFSAGTTVLDLPFCVAGGNGVCTAAQCPNYPKSTIGQCFGMWHEKKVFGLYQSRLVESQCGIYNHAPYVSWFDAWARQRCFTDAEFTNFCAYLDSHGEFSAILVYPDIWVGAASAECKVKFDSHLGEPVGEGVFQSDARRGGRPADLMRVIKYRPKCI